MPEIAEVRVVANTLKKELLNKRIKKVNILYKGIIEGDINGFIKNIEGKTIKDITTYGKWIMFNLGDVTLLSHLRMEGKYFYVPTNQNANKHTHVIFTLNNDMDLRYNDVRKFGKMILVGSSHIYENKHISKLGYEPDDKRLTEEYLLNKFKGKNKPIKTVLLDQTIINGLGNIYANEVLFKAKISPFRSACSITESDASAIIDSSRKIIKKAYEYGGTTIKSYTSSLGVQGHYQDELCVQSREGQPCPICGTVIQRCKLGGRSTFYCEKCQK